MPLLLVTLITFLALSAVFDFDPGPAPGLNIKNALLYLLALGLLFRVAMDRNYRIQLPAIPIVFAVMIGYAIVTYVVIVLALDYPHYRVLISAFDLKNTLVDQLMFFLVFFYGLRSDKVALLVLKCLVFTFALSHAAAVLDALGAVQIGEIEQRDDGRVEGAIGESNQYGAFAAFSLPAILSLAFVTRGVWRMMWTLAAFITAVALIMTVSRGAFVAITTATVCGAWLFRRHVPPGRLVMWAGCGLIGALLLLGVVTALGYGELLYQRVVASTGGDMGGTSSGRTEIWSDAIRVMFEEPLTLLTGYGWRAYQSMPFRYAPHNYYLAQWFNLGLPGVVCGVLLLVLPIRIARSVMVSSPAHLRPLFIGFVISVIALATATFFVDIYQSWLYFWAYAGVVMRLAANVREQSEQAPDLSAQAPALSPASDPFGWRGVMRH